MIFSIVFLFPISLISAVAFTIFFPCACFALLFLVLGGRESLIDLSLFLSNREGVLQEEVEVQGPHVVFTQDHIVSCGVGTQAKTQGLKYSIIML